MTENTLICFLCRAKGRFKKADEIKQKDLLSTIIRFFGGLHRSNCSAPQFSQTLSRTDSVCEVCDNLLLDFEVCHKRLQSIAKQVMDLIAKTADQHESPNDMSNTFCQTSKDIKMGSKNLSPIKIKQCPHCPSRFSKESSLKDHVVVHSPVKAFRCSIDSCQLTFKRAKALKSHQKRQHSNEPLTHLCGFCGKSFKSYTGLKKHQAKHTGEEYLKRKSVCDVCSKAFMSPADLKIHSVVHSKVKAFVCNVCGAAFAQKAVLKDHENIHNETFKCVKCQKCFTRRRQLTAHHKICKKSEDDNGLTSSQAKDIVLITSKHGNHDFSQGPVQHLSHTVNGEDIQVQVVQRIPGLDNSSAAAQGLGSSQVVATSSATSPRTSSDEGLVTAAHSAAEVLAQLTNQGTITMLQYSSSSSDLCQ